MSISTLPYIVPEKSDITIGQQTPSSRSEDRAAFAQEYKSSSNDDNSRRSGPLSGDSKTTDTDIPVPTGRSIADEITVQNAKEFDKATQGTAPIVIESPTITTLRTDTAKPNLEHTIAPLAKNANTPAHIGQTKLTSRDLTSATNSSTSKIELGDTDAILKTETKAVSATITPAARSRAEHAHSPKAPLITQTDADLPLRTETSAGLAVTAKLKSENLAQTPTPGSMQISADERSEVLFHRPQEQNALTTSRTTGPALPTTIPTSSLAAAPQTQIANAIRVHSTEQKISIRLDPAELGNVTIELSYDKSAKLISATVAAEQLDTASLLRRQLDSLQRELNEAGFDGVEVDIDEHKANQNQESDDWTQWALEQNTTPNGNRISADMSPTAPINIIGTDRIDARF